MSRFKTWGRRTASLLTGIPGVRSSLRSLGAHYSLPRTVWERLPVEGTFVVTLPDGATFRYHAVPQDYVGRALYWRGVTDWEAETLGVFYQEAKSARTVLDIGANTGAYSLLACAANPAAEVYAFEPVPHVFRLLQTNIEVNGWSARCHIENRAVSAATGMVQLHVPRLTIPMTASLDPAGFRGLEGDLIDVHTTTIDAFCAGLKVDLVKLDVEGFEDQVLAGMEQTLRNSAPTIIVECNPDGPYHAIESILGRHGYSFYHLNAAGPTPVPQIRPDPTEHYRNYLCRPPAKLSH